MLLYWLWLAGCEDINDGVKAALVRHFEDPEAIFRADKDTLRQANIEGLTEKHAEILLRHDLRNAEALLTDCANSGLKVLTLGEEAYPKRLKNLYDAPVVLYYKGTLPEFDALPTLALVGTRHPSDYGRQAAARLGGEIAEAGGLVVSGLAEGIDASAMGAALERGYPAVGVLGCGADIVYPRKNSRLFQKTESLGCIFSEFAPGSPPLGWHFPKRNRIISGLSCGVVVVEAPEKSGALLTAKHALEQGRDVFVVPGPIDTEGFRGSNRLLRDGAIAVAAGQEIMEEYRGIYPDKLLRMEHKKAPSTQTKPAVPKKLKKITIDNGDSPPYSEQNDPLAGFSEEERAVMAAIGSGIQSVDDVIAISHLPSGKVLGLLTMLEIRKKILRHPGRRVSRRQ